MKIEPPQNLLIPQYNSQLPPPSPTLGVVVVVVVIHVDLRDLDKLLILCDDVFKIKIYWFYYCSIGNAKWTNKGNNPN